MRQAQHSINVSCHVIPSHTQACVLPKDRESLPISASLMPVPFPAREKSCRSLQKRQQSGAQRGEVIGLGSHSSEATEASLVLRQTPARGCAPAPPRWLLSPCQPPGGHRMLNKDPNLRVRTQEVPAQRWLRCCLGRTKVHLSAPAWMGTCFPGHMGSHCPPVAMSPQPGLRLPVLGGRHRATGLVPSEIRVCRVWPAA